MDNDFEKAWIVTYSEEGVKLTTPDQQTASVKWEELLGIFMETDDSGPFGSDVRWILATSARSLVFPLGCDGEQELLTRLQKLPNFQNSTLIEAMASTEPALFKLWERQA